MDASSLDGNYGIIQPSVLQDDHAFSLLRVECSSDRREDDAEV